MKSINSVGVMKQPAASHGSTRFVYWALAVLLLSGLFAPPVMATDEPTLIYMVRHSHVDLQDPDKPLTANGHAGAALLADRFKSIPLTHVYSTHTDRTHDTVKPLAESQGLNVQRIPALGASVKGETVTNRSKGTIAIDPMVKALRNLPPGSTVVVSANSGNIYGILAELGARVGQDIPCADKSCFPTEEFDNLWLLIRGPEGQVTLARFRYGQPCG